MKLIISPNKLETVFKNLLKQYKHYYWATAWASSKSNLFNLLVRYKNRIEKITVGIHFYQTHPDFIEEFVNNKNVHFIQQPDGTFHPKCYLFYNTDKDWELLIGSPNFTNGAFQKNTEATVLISSKDQDSSSVYNNAIKLIYDSWENGEIFAKEDLENYRITWKNHLPKVRSLAGKYGSIKKKGNPIFKVEIMYNNWDDFIAKVKKDRYHFLEKRIRVIEIAQQLFNSVKHFNQLEEDKRKFIAGIPNNLSIDGAEDWGYFGSMKGAGKFKNRIIENDKNISDALDQIPSSGQITKSQYTNFIKYFRETFNGNYIATATRLLAMKRPDTFVCLDSKNKANLCKDFGITQSGIDYEKYWEDIIERIFDSDWWQNPKPKNKIEQKISNARAAFLDSIYYEYY